jgi:hypothetical protein
MYDQGTPVDSVSINTSGYIRGNILNKLIVKSRSGRYYVLSNASASGTGSSASIAFWFSNVYKSSIFD